MSDISKIPTSSLFSLANRTILVTGGARGLGLTIAQGLLESGADVVCFDLLPPQDGWSAAEAAAKAGGRKLSYTALDITDAEATEIAVKAAFESAAPGYPVRGVFHAAGIQLMKPAEEITPAQWRKVLDVNLTGSFVIAAAFARSFFVQREKGEKGEGSVVFVASMSGRVANDGLDCAVYNASKAGVAQLARNLAMEWGKKGIRANSLSPGYIITALTGALLDERPDFKELWTARSMLGRLSVAEEFRGPAIFLLSEAASFCTGSDIVVDGGHTAH